MVSVCVTRGPCSLPKASILTGQGQQLLVSHKQERQGSLVEQQNPTLTGLEVDVYTVASVTLICTLAIFSLVIGYTIIENEYVKQHSR